MTNVPRQPNTPSDDASPELDHLNTLLDTMVSGKRAPESVPVSGADALAATARLVSVQSDASAEETASDDTLDSIWRNVMQAHGHAADAATGTHAGDGTPTSRPRIPRSLPIPWPSGQLNTLLSAAAVALLLIGMAGAAWGLRGIGNGGGGGGNDGPHYLAAVTLQDGSTVEIEYRMPKPEDCTVEPLTVDEVMDRLENYRHYGRSDARATAIAESATPVPAHIGGNVVFPLEEPTYEALAAAQREWLACTLYGSPFQVWALETNTRIREQITALFMPAINLDGIREELEKAADAHQTDAEFSGVTREFPSDTWLPMVPAHSEGYYNLQFSGIEATLTVFWMNEDGEALLGFGKTADDPQMKPYLEASALEQLLPNEWAFIYDDASGQWLLHDMQFMAG